MKNPVVGDAAETIDDKIARLRRELTEAEMEKLDDELSEAAGVFMSLSGGVEPAEEVREAISILRKAWETFDSWRAWRREQAVKNGGAKLLGPVLDLEPPRTAEVVSVLAPPPASEPTPASPRTGYVVAGKRSVRRRRCGYCREVGHDFRNCPQRHDRVTPADVEPTPPPTSAPALPPANRDEEPDEPGDDVDNAWSLPDADGRQTCLICEGEGIDRRDGGTIACLHCDGEGYRWPDEPYEERKRLLALAHVREQ